MLSLKKKVANLLILLLVALFGQTANAAVCTTRPTLRRRSGYSGSVRELQSILRRKGYSIGVDGYFGSGTERVVKSYQRSNGLSADGIVGRNTWSRLCSTGTAPTTGVCQASRNPHPIRSRGGSASWNPIAKHVVDNVWRCFQSLQVAYPTTYVSGSSKSDHPGNGIDMWPTKYGTYASGTQLTNGWKIANWLKANSSTLKVRYVIWQNKIWNSRRAAEGWRNQNKSGATAGHYDHIHVSVYSNIN